MAPAPSSQLILMVPVHLDALVLEKRTRLVEPMADFSRLPWTDGERDYSSATVNLSEEILSLPFENLNLTLEPGVHLHWALPDALTRGAHGKHGTVFPAVPNRWLVSRRRGDRVEGQWVVESDYLWPEPEGGASGSVTVPQAAPDGTPGSPPYRHLGRKIDWQSWLAAAPAGSTGERFDRLTALGHGELSFAAFYPNCHSVFGLHDPEPFDGSPPRDLVYEVIGWYGGPAARDHLTTLRTLVTKIQAVADKKQVSDEELLHLDREGKLAGELAADAELGELGLTPAELTTLVAAWRVDPQRDLRQAVQALAGWTWEPTKPDGLPERMVCYGSLAFAPDSASTAGETAAGESSKLAVSVGSTATEALAALLADRVATPPAAPESDDEATPGTKTEIEDLLESLILAPDLEHRRLDVGAKFREARHTQGFAARAGGTRWGIVPVADKVAAEDTLAPKLAGLLHELNAGQRDLEVAEAVLKAHRGQLFADWCKYMVCAHPPVDSGVDYPHVDEVHSYLETRGLAELGEASARRDAAADRLQSALAEVQGALTKTSSHRLRPHPGPRFWQPAEPVVAIAGDLATPTDRHGRDGRLGEGLLACAVVSMSGDGGEELGRDQLVGLLDELRSRRPEDFPPQDGKEAVDGVAFRVWTGNPWNPFLLEWEVELFPTWKGSTGETDGGAYDTAYVTGSYGLSANAPDLSLGEGRGNVSEVATIYTGRSLLTSQGGRRLQAALEEYLARNGALEDGRLTAETDKPAKPVKIAVDAYRRILETPCLSQALSGFNDALLMRRQAMQLAIADPLGFPEYRKFTEWVATAVGHHVMGSPQPLDDFQPLRAGALRLVRLRLVDTFGRHRDVDGGSAETPPEWVTAEPLTLPRAPGRVDDPDGGQLPRPQWAFLPPRLVQPARLVFRWLSADNDQIEVNDHPATSPVCGWLVPNNLDGSLEVFRGDGSPLGTVDGSAGWGAPPGTDTVAGKDDMNGHLWQLLQRLGGEGSRGDGAAEGFLQSFLDTLDSALGHIDPEGFAQHQGLAILMGRPVALVRAELSLALEGRPAVHQGWKEFEMAMRENLPLDRRQTAALGGVEIPVRIGEREQLNDGLVGFWVEEDGKPVGPLYAPQSTAASAGQDGPPIQPHTDAPLTLAPGSEPRRLTLLLDPRGVLHATTGVLPTGVLSIPQDQYAAALASIQVTFVTAPILGGVDRPSMPLPKEPGWVWSWVAKATPPKPINEAIEKPEWREIPAEGIGKPSLDAVFSGPQIARDGWLKLGPAPAAAAQTSGASSPEQREE